MIEADVRGKEYQERNRETLKKLEMQAKRKMEKEHAGEGRKRGDGDEGGEGEREVAEHPIAVEDEAKPHGRDLAHTHTSAFIWQGAFVNRTPRILILFSPMKQAPKNESTVLTSHWPHLILLSATM